MKLKKQLCMFTFLLAFLFLFSACADTAKIEAAKKKSEATLVYLQQAQKDMASVHTVLNDTELDLGNMDKEESEESQDVQPQKLQSLIGKIEGYKTDLQNRIADVKKKDTLKDTELANFSQSELHCMQLLTEVLDEYGQICNYLILLSDMEAKVGAFQMDANDLGASYQGITEVIDNVLGQLNATEPPSFLQSFHADMIVLFTELKSGAEYLLSAIAMNDPLRTNAGMYRFNILFRDIGQATNSLNTDVERRINKIKEDADALEKMDTGLTEWLEANIERFEKLEGGEVK